MRALVIDDSTTSRLFHRDILEAAGFEVEEAENGLEGLERVLAAPPFDLALVDINMPLMDGYGFLRALRRDDRHMDLPVIVASTEHEGSEVDNAFAAGANLYLSKPVKPAALTRYAQALATASGASAA